MSAQGAEVPVGGEEWLARFILHRDQVRPDGTVKPDPFIPYRHVELSVTRHKNPVDLTVEQLWAAGELVAAQTGKQLHGRADVQAENCFRQKLAVEPQPLPQNPNHANVKGWSMEKSRQKAIALELVRQARWSARPVIAKSDRAD